MSTFGQAVPLSEGNLRKYSFVPKEGAAITHFDYVLKTVKADPSGAGGPKVSQGNVFAAGWSLG